MQVSVGDPIAKMGNSGQVWSSRRDGTHLHLWYYKVDETYIQAVRDAKRPELFKESNAKKSAWFRWLDPETYLRDGPWGWSPAPTPPSPPGPEIKKTLRNWITPPEAKPFPREVVGSTPEQRLKSFVTYMWYDSAIINRLSAKHNIDPALIPAIIRAEHGKWPPANNNPGNVVGISPTSLEEWLTKMAEVFSNSYQSQNKTIWSLNGYWRRLAGMPSCDVSGQYCYATDTSWAWHNNVTNFMSFVYDTKIDYTYQFRRSAKHRESADTEYLKRTPNKYVTERCMFNNVSYNSYMPQLSPPIGQDPQNAPWWWLIRIQDEKISLVTPSGTYPLTSSRISVEGVSYTVRATLNTTDPLYPRAAQFSLSR